MQSNSEHVWRSKSAWLGFLAILMAGCVAFNGTDSRADTLAQWRFEDGKAGARFAAGTEVVADAAGKSNELAVANEDTQPVYSADVPYAKVPQSAETNANAANFTSESDFFTRDQPLNSFNFSPNGSNAWTVELSLRVRSVTGVNRVFGRDGNSPNGETRGPLQILTLGDDGSDTFDIRVEILDGGNTFRDVVSPRTYRTGRWYNIATTANANTLNLYVDALDGKGYQLVGSKAINGALSATPGGFSIGRGWNNQPADWMNGKVDEVRISDVALKPPQFLFSQPGAGRKFRRCAAAVKTKPMR